MKLVVEAAVILLVLCAGGLSQTVRFSSDGRDQANPFTIANNLIIVKASVGRASEGWFIFDTGAESTVVDAKYAGAAGLAQSGKTIGTGSAGTAEAGVMKGVTLNVGNISASELTVYSLPLDSISVGLGMKIAGIIGNDIIAKTVAEVDYRGQRLTLYRPEEFRVPSGAEMVALRMEEHLPFVNVPIRVGTTTINAKMEIDTGSTGAVLFNSPFVRKNALRRSLGRTMGSRTGGVGGTGTSLVARLDSILLGKSAVIGPLASLYTGTKGDNASASYDGLLGGAIFRRFRMTIDIPGKRLFLEPTASVSDPFETDMSGMDLLADGPELDRIRVDDVKPASVAAKAGVRGGEFIRSLNGRPALEIGLQEVRKMLRTRGEYDVELARGRRVFTVHLVLKRVI